MESLSITGRGSLHSRFPVLIAVFALLVLVASEANGIDACVGPTTNSITVTLLSNSATYVSIPFTRKPAFCGWVKTISHNTITVVDDTDSPPTPGLNTLTPGGSNSYCVVITSGLKEGAIYTTNNTVAITTNSVTVNSPPDSCEDLTGVAVGGANVGDRIAVIPDWTLATLWPGAPPNGVTQGINTSFATSITLFTEQHPFGETFLYRGPMVVGGAGWYATSTITVRRPNQSIPPYQTLKIVQPAAASNITFTPPGGEAGYEIKYTTRTCLIAPPAGPDPDYNFVSNYHYYSSGSGQTLDSSGLTNSIVASDTSASPPQITDQMLAFDNAERNQFKTPAHIYIYDVNHWADLKNPPYTTDRGGDQVFQAGTGVVIVRKPSASSPLIWVDPL